ncbi:Leukocyte receptor cluster member 8, partial [Clarias magur]
INHHLLLIRDSRGREGERGKCRRRERGRERGEKCVFLISCISPHFSLFSYALDMDT